jgi:RNA 2',3'-cyclic 3'-phosphodiesterase
VRLFVAIALPDPVADELLMMQEGVTGARWSDRENLHLTLRFLGEVDGRDANAVDDALSAIRATKFTLQLKGAGEFGSKMPRALWAGIAPNEALLHLQRKIETALQRIGLDAEQRKFVPHVTLAYLKGAPRERVMDFVVRHALYASAPFEVEEFILYSSHLSPNGSSYVAERSYPLL